MPKLIVVDTSVARSAGDLNSEDSQSAGCRQLLLSIRSICHKCVLTDELVQEWRRHRSRFARTWLTSMYARRKVVRVELRNASAIDGKLKEIQGKAGEALRKDAHLLKAALETDAIIVSRDATVRAFTRQVAERVPELGTITWIGPEEHALLDKLGGSQ